MCGVSTTITDKNIMKQQLQKKFYAFIITAMMFFVNANAQIIYTDVIPDTTVNTNATLYHLDLNNDGTIDFNFNYLTQFISQTCETATDTGTNIYLTITPLGSNKVGTTNVYPSNLLLNSVIDNSSVTWSSTANQNLFVRSWHCSSLMGVPIWVSFIDGNYLGNATGFVPLRLNMNSQNYYGWAQLHIAMQPASCTIMDYAYNSVPNQPILAGQTTATGIIENSFASLIHLFPNPAKNQLTIDNGKLKIENVTIYDLTGREVYSENHQTPNANPEIIIDVSKFPAGVYMVQIQTADFIGTKKLIVEK